MNMEFLCGGSPVLMSKLQKLGHDPESLHYISKDFFELCGHLAYSARETAEMFIRIKKAVEAIGTGMDPSLTLYENNRYSPTRLSVVQKLTGKTLFFKMVQGQSLAEKKNILYTCENCANDMCIKRAEAKEHFMSFHQ